MSVVWDSPAVTTGEATTANATAYTLASLVTAGAVLYNVLLCFINTNLFGISPTAVVLVEIALIGAALGLIWHRSYTLYTVLLLFAVYFLALMVIRSEFDPKILRDLLIPIVFFFVGRSLGCTRSADRLVTFLIIVALSFALFEWFAPGMFLHYFNVVNYYIARGTVSGLDSENTFVLSSGFFNSSRFDNRTLLPFLGDHRVSGIFLEAPSVGNFGAIVFAWVLLRERKNYWTFGAKLAAIAAIVVLADARFGLYFCIITLIIYAATPYIRTSVLFITPFLVIIALASYAAVSWEGTWDNTITGRLLYAGHILTTLDPLEFYGLLGSNINIGVNFAVNAVNDSGYAYALIKMGLFGVAGIWALFALAPVRERDALRYKNFVACYYIVLLTISASVFTIKTAALLWFLYGTLSNPSRAEMDPLHFETR